MAIPERGNPTAATDTRARMKIQTVDAEMWWLGNADEIRSPLGYPLREAITKLNEAFLFFSGPTTIPTGPNEGFVFRQGSLIDGVVSVVIQQVIIYNAAIHVTVAGPSDGADRVFEKIAEILQSLGVRQPVTSPVQFYRSTIVCDLDKPIETLFANYRNIIEILQGKGCLPEIKIHETGIAFSADPAELPQNMVTYNPTLFTMNCRVDVGFSMNRYLCFANMKTDEHIEALTQIERLL